MATAALSSCKHLVAQLGGGGYPHVKVLIPVIPGQQHLFTVTASLALVNDVAAPVFAAGALYYAIHNDYSTTSGYAHNVFYQTGSGLQAYVTDSSTPSILGENLIQMVGCSPTFPVVLQGVLPLVSNNLNGDGSAPAYVCNTPTARQFVTIPTGWSGPSGYPSDVVLEIFVPWNGGSVGSGLNVMLVMSWAMMCPSNGTSPITQLTDLPATSSTTASDVNIAQIGGNNVTTSIANLPVNLASIAGTALSTATLSTNLVQVDSVALTSSVLPTNLVQMDSVNLTSATMPVNITQIESTALSAPRIPVDVAAVSGATFSTGSVPVDVEMVHASALSTSYLPVDIAEIAGTAVSGSNPLPTSVTGTVTTNIQQVLGATVSSSNPLPTSGGGGGGGSSAGTTPNNPMYVYPVS